MAAIRLKSAIRQGKRIKLHGYAAPCPDDPHRTEEGHSSVNALLARSLALCLATATAPVLAGDDCDAPAERWQPREAVFQHAAGEGWVVQRLKIDDGCYEIRGRDAQGRAFRARLDPETLRVVRMKWRDRDQERKRGRRAHAVDPSPAPEPPLRGHAPRGEVE